MANIQVNFSGRDFTAEYERLLALLRSELPEYTDLNHSDTGIVFLRLVARETDQLNSYIDRVANEGFIATAQFKQSLLDLGSLVGYTPTFASPANTTLQFTRLDGVDGKITIPIYSVFERSDGVSYLTVQEVSLEAPDTTATVVAIQGTRVVQPLHNTDFLTSDWSSRAKVDIGAGVVEDYVEVFYGVETTLYYNYVQSFWRSVPTDLHFSLELNGDNDHVYLVFGDGVKGAEPNMDSLTTAYINTLGAQGNCGKGLITVVPDSFSTLISCTNIEIATGGAAAENIASLRRQIPAVTRTQRRGVTKEDYEALIQHLPGILHAQVLDRTDSPEWPHWYITAYIVPDGGGPLTQGLKYNIWDELGQWGHLGEWHTRYILKDAIEFPIDISVRIGVDINRNSVTVVESVRTALNAFFLPEERLLQETIEFGDLYQVVDSVSGVSWVDFNAPQEDIVLSVGEIAVAGTFTITVGS